MKYLSPIDPHVHLRGDEYKTNFLEMGFQDAKSVGLLAMIEQPNPKPWLTTEETIKNRYEKVKPYSEKTNITHKIHIGLTNDLDQVKKTLSLVTSNKYGLVSDKTFYTHSTGNMGILDEDIQREIWKLKGSRSGIDYRGISIGHFEDEKEFGGIFNPEFPVTHSKHQNPQAELVQVHKQIRNARDQKFKGTFYIAHVSNPETIDYIEEERKKGLSFRVVIESTFHHPLLNWSDYAIHGNRVKMNPPLRDIEMQEKLLEYILAGRIDIIGTDHAPHPLERKDDEEKPASGIPAILFWPKGIELFRKLGMREEKLQDITVHNANNLFFKGKLTPRLVNINYNPELWERYGCNYFSRVDN